MIDKRILPQEKEIVGAWELQQGVVKASEAARRIDDLVERYLESVAASTDGWSRLFRDPSDGRYWELTYPEGSSHGGGAPRLTNISREDAASRYDI